MKIGCSNFTQTNADTWKLKTKSQRTGNRGHSLKLFTQRAKLNLRKNLFPIRITELWNSLPDTEVTAKSIESFKTRLDKYWYTQDIVCDFEALLRITNNRTAILY